MSSNWSEKRDSFQNNADNCSSEDNQSILLVEKNPDLRSSVYSMLCDKYRIEEALDCQQALNHIKRHSFDCILIGVSRFGDDILPTIKNISNMAQAPVIIICCAAEISKAVRAMRNGASEFIIVEIELNKIASRIEKAISSRCNNQGSTNSGPRSDNPGPSRAMVTGQSSNMLNIMKIARKVANTPVPILILGESGTGKEMLAKWIHQSSNRAEGPFVAVNLAAIPSDLVESTLFGHEKGAFTGAVGNRIGMFSMAQNGTLLLDEISEIKLELQAKLLRVLQENEYFRVGSDKCIQSKARIIAATNQQLDNEVNNGNFRLDLYYRLNVITLKLPPLREREKDIPDLAELFLTKYNKIYGCNAQGFSSEAMEALVQYNWPGNIRQLENKIQRAVIMVQDEYVSCEDLFEDEQPDIIEISTQVGNRNGTLEDLEHCYIEQILQRTGGHQGQAAKILGIDRKTLYNKIMKYGLGQSLNRKTGQQNLSEKTPVDEENFQENRSYCS